MPLRAYPLKQFVLERRELEEEVLRLPEHWRIPAEAAADSDQFLRVERPPAVVALVAARAVEIAVRARPLHVPVRQEPPVHLAVRLEHRLRVQIPILVETAEDVLRHLRVVLRVRGREQIEADAEPLPAVEELGVVLPEHFLRADAPLLRFQRHGRPVRIAAGHHQDIVALQPVVSREDVRRNVRPRRMADVYGAVGVRPSHGNKYALRHQLLGTINSINTTTTAPPKPIVPSPLPFAGEG